MNWYMVLRPFDNYTRTSAPILLEGSLRHLELERMGFLRLIGPAMQVEPETVELDEIRLPTKRGRRGKQVQAGPPESEPAGEVPGDELRGSDVAAD